VQAGRQCATDCRHRSRSVFAPACLQTAQQRAQEYSGGDRQEGDSEESEGNADLKQIAVSMPPGSSEIRRLNDRESLPKGTQANAKEGRSRPEIECRVIGGQALVQLEFVP